MSTLVRRLLAALAVLTLALSAACSTDSAGSSTSTTGGEITVAQVTEPDTTDPLMTSSLAGYNLFYAVFDRLTGFDNDGKIQPGLAKSWTHNADFTVWDFTLQPGVKFHNGEPLKASDVAFSYNFVKKTPTSGNSFFVSVMKSAKVTSDSTVQFTLNQAFSAWPAQTSAISIVPEDVYTKLGTEGFAKAPVGTGPFTFVSWQRGVNYVVAKNPDYWGTKPTLDKVTFSLVAAEDARVNGVQSGSLNVGLIPPNQVPTVEGSGTAAVATKAANEVTFLGMNSTSGPLADARVRKALSLAIDRKAIVDNLLGGLGQLNAQLVAPSVTGFVEGFPEPTYDTAQATALLQEAGYQGEEITFEYATDGRIPLSSEIAQALAAYWEKVGVKIKLVGADQASHSLKVAGKKMK
ncbi:MAG: ABC transporter substrate-binding protein, partial [Propionibacteriaceae bacterium]